MNKRLLLIGLIILGFSISNVVAQGGYVNWLGYDWFVTYGTATVNPSNDLVISAVAVGDGSYRGNVFYVPNSISQNPWAQFSFITPADDVTINIEFDGFPDYLIISINSTNFGYYARTPTYIEYVDSLPMPPELWNKPSHVVSFGVRENGYIDLWMDDWKKMTIMDSSFIDSAYILQGMAQLDITAKIAGQNTIFIDYLIEDNYVYVPTAPEITFLTYTNNLDEGPNPATITLNAEFIDAEGWDTFTGTIDWGDGTVEAFNSLSFAPDGYPLLTGTGNVIAEHTYLNNGTYDATLTVTDVERLSDSALFTVTVNEVPPTVSYSWTAAASDTGYDVTLIPSVDTYPDNFDRYEWSVNGTFYATTYDDIELVLSFDDQLKHEIVLTAFEQDVDTGAENSATFTDTVEALFPEAEIIYISDDTPIEGQSIDIHVGLTNPETEFQMISVNWKFSDGTKSTTSSGTISHQFWKNGTQSFEATINTDKEVSAKITGYVNVSEVAPVVEILGSSPSPVPVGEHVFIQWRFTDSPADGSWSYQWKTNPVSGIQVELTDWSSITPIPGVIYNSELYMQSPDYNLLSITLTPTDGVPVTASIPVVVKTAPTYTFTGPTVAETGDSLTYTLTITSPKITYINNVKWIVDGVVQLSFKPGINVMTYTTSFTTDSEEPVNHTVGIEITDFKNLIYPDEINVSVVYTPKPPAPETPLELKKAAYQMLADTREEMNIKIDSLGKHGKNLINAFDSALEYIDDSTNPRYWVDNVSLTSKEGKKVFDAEKNAVDKIEYIIEKWDKELPGDPLIAEWRNVITTLVGADKIIAENVLNAAQSLAGPDPSEKVANHLENSQSFIDKASLEDLEKPSHAIELYREAWQQAQDALKKF